MTRDEPRQPSPLALCAGFEAVADDGPIGTVETPLFPADAAEPDFLVLRVGVWPRTHRPVVPAALVAEVDLDRRTMRFRGSRNELAGFPERLPVAI
jgi:hypothetical protein